MASLGLVISAMLLLLKVALLVVFGVQWQRGLPRYKLHNLLKAIILLNAVIFPAAGLFTNFLRDKMPSIEESRCETADADLIGDGVFYGILLQEVLLALIATYGLWHQSPNAMKEAGAGLLVTHVSLIIALFVPWAFRKPLSMVDAILGSMILDSENAALSIQLFSKETMASRWQVSMTLIAQVAGLTVLAIIVDSFARGLLDNKQCDCFSVFWWGWISNCPNIPSDIAPFWTYFALRSLVILQFTVISFLETGEFNQAEKEDRERPCTHHRNCGLCGRCHRCHYMKPSCELVGLCPQCRRCTCGRLPQCVPRYSDRDATSSPIYAESVSLALLSFWRLQLTIRYDYDIKPSSEIYSVGQITAIVIAAVTFVRSFWVFIRG
ncbi:hypothetical protein ASPFODRAFT_48121 [Aspergillus luchuensis CBS 106.47]|uniref:Uncharacterized protein n=1 Tax=Aspergillus luchuensis (strain CBS 106.47) TaxID=1137211 RepID=A0A1M3TFM9_ASPLC|nr:hypothetical protein ASPFODRAFT_48121 [Aspergillus luchuensis CBS 106.47]